MSGIRVAILDDAPYVSWNGQVHAVNATFHRFAAALLEVRDASDVAIVERVVLAAPVRPALVAPETLPVDRRIRVVPTEPFDGIAGYLRRAPAMVAGNAPRLRRAFRDCDVVLLRLPASNGLLGAVLAATLGRPRIAFVVGSVRDVVAGQGRNGLPGVAARLVGAGYDAMTRLAATGGETIVVGADPAGDGILSSLVLPAELRDRRGAPWPHRAPSLRLVYAGRLAEGKGLDDLLAAVEMLAVSEAPGASAGVTLDLVGDGPARATLESRAAALGIADRVRFAGYLAEREPYLRAIAAADAFVSPSPAEGFPKAVLDAMAVGVPVVAVPAGRLADIAAARATPDGAAILPVRASDPAAIAAAIRSLAGDPPEARRLRAAGAAFAAAHTMPAEAARLADVLRRRASRGVGEGRVRRR